MRTVLSRLRYFLADAADEWRHSPWVNLLATASLAAVLFLAGVILVVMHNVQGHLERSRNEVRVDVFLRDGASDEAKRAVRSRLAACPGVSRVAFVDKGEALRRFRRVFTNLADLPGDLGTNPLPESFEAYLDPGPRSSQVAREIAASLAGQSGVEEVKFDRQWLDRLEALLGTARRVGLGLGAGVFTAVVFIMASVLRLAVYARRDEIEVMLLVGATPSFVRGPFLISGLAQGLVASLASLTLVESARRASLSSEASGAGILLDLVAGRPLPGSYSALLVVAGLVVGLASAFFAVRGQAAVES